MRAAASSLALLLLVAGCGKDSRQQAQANNAAATDIESLPADESAATPTDELENGANEPPVNAVLVGD